MFGYPPNLSINIFLENRKKKIEMILENYGKNNGQEKSKLSKELMVLNMRINLNK